VDEIPDALVTPFTFLQLQEEERYRLARALMSGPGQILANTLMEVESSLPLVETNARLALEGLSALRQELRDGLAELKDYVAELQPPLLAEMGLGPCITQYASRFSRRTGILTECIGCSSFRERYPGTIEVAIFRILQEALGNVERHSQASRVRVTLSWRASQLRLVVQDNGRGFAPSGVEEPRARQLGLIMMRDRAELVGGSLKIYSEAGRGVRLVVSIPYHGHSQHEISAPRGEQDYEQQVNLSNTRVESARHRPKNGGRPHRTRGKSKTDAPDSGSRGIAGRAR
jgi:two-component system sensor histidine kinase DegS